MKMFEHFFGQDPELPDDHKKIEQQNQESQKEMARIVAELSALDLSPSTLEKLEPREVSELNTKIFQLQRDYQNLSGGSFRPSFSEYLKNLTKESDIIAHFLTQPERIKQFLKQLFDDTLFEYVIAEKLKEYDRENWREVFDREIAKGKTPFGDQSSIIEDFYTKKGINIKNPMPLDIDAFFARKEYTAGNIGNELERRRVEKFHLNEQERSDITELFWRFFRVPDDGGWFSTMKEQELKVKTEELKQKLGF